MFLSKMILFASPPYYKPTPYHGQNLLVLGFD
jgi:hypothetical protein